MTQSAVRAAVPDPSPTCWRRKSCHGPVPITTLAPSYAGCIDAPVRIVHLGQVPYLEAWELQRTTAAAVIAGEAPEPVLFLEHPPVVTVGRRTGPDELHVPDGVEVDVVETNRGGKSTFHGPGQ